MTHGRAGYSEPVDDERWWRGVDDRLVALLESGGRVLDVGCGGGGLVRRLRSRGLEAYGVDPRAPRHPHLTAAKVEELDGDKAYDAVSAVMSLHHVDLEPVCDAIARLLRPEGVLVVAEFDWPAYDARAARWRSEVDRSSADRSVSGWRAEHEGLHAGPTLRAALTRAFVVEAEQRGPYLARMLRRPELEDDERAQIDGGRLPALGLGYVCRQIQPRRRKTA